MGLTKNVRPLFFCVYIFVFLFPDLIAEVYFQPGFYYHIKFCILSDELIKNNQKDN